MVKGGNTGYLLATDIFIPFPTMFSSIPWTTVNFFRRAMANSSLDHKISALSKLKASADENCQIFYDRADNIEGKEENASSPLPTMFSKGFFFDRDMRLFEKRLICSLQMLQIQTSLKSCPMLTHYQTTNFRLFQTERVCIRQFQI